MTVPFDPLTGDHTLDANRAWRAVEPDRQARIASLRGEDAWQAGYAERLYDERLLRDSGAAVPTPAADALREAVERLFGWMDSRPVEHALYADLRTIVDAALAAVPAVRERDDQAGERVSCVCGGPLIDGGAGEWMHANGDDARFGHRGHPATDDQAGEVVNDRYAHDTAGCCGDGENAWPTPCPTHGVTRPAEDGEPR